jgi:hypothetical protein
MWRPDPLLLPPSASLLIGLDESFNGTVKGLLYIVRKEAGG